MGVDLQRPGVDGIEVIPKADEFSAVADISCIDYLKDGAGNEKDNILLGGVGMELWHIDGWIGHPNFEKTEETHT